MADLRPYRAWHYEVSDRRKAAERLAPPYDKIDAALAERLRARSPENFVRLSLGEGALDPADPSGRYQTSARVMREWQARGTLVQAAAPCLFAHEQRFEVGGRPYRRLALIAAGRLAAFSERIVLPHERVLAAAKLDRLHLLRATRANFGQILMLYRDAQGAVRRELEQAMGATPMLEAHDDQGADNRLWPITDVASIRRIRACFASLQTTIADGHHRYQTALEYRDENPTVAADADAAINFGQWALVAMEDPGVVILATHRLIAQAYSGDGAALARALGAHFSVTPVDDPVTALERSPRHTLILVSRSLARPLALQVSPAGRAHLGRRLGQVGDASLSVDANAAQELILAEIFGIDRERAAAGALAYVRDAREAVARVASGAVESAILLQPVAPAEVVAVAEAGDVMPQKSTDFFPKILGGLAFLDVRPGERVLVP